MYFYNPYKFATSPLCSAATPSPRWSPCSLQDSANQQVRFHLKKKSTSELTSSFFQIKWVMWWLFTYAEVLFHFLELIWGVDLVGQHLTARFGVKCWFQEEKRKFGWKRQKLIKNFILQIILISPVQDIPCFGSLTGLGWVDKYNIQIFKYFSKIR